MPALIHDTSPSSVASSDSLSSSLHDVQGIVLDGNYAGRQLSSSELPLSQQLEPIAVVGMGCRLPGDIKSPADFWSMMINKASGQTPKVPLSRFNIDAHLHENNDRPGSFGVKGGYFLNETLKAFDPSFFGITPVEAMWMDPQQRKLLEVVYECFESAGLSLDQLSGSDTACFIATFTADYQQMSFKEPSFRHSLAATGVDPGLLSNRVSHVFNLKGPSIVVNTACSSSVYAIHNACNALRNGECGAAVVGGSNLILTVDQHMNTAKLGVLSPTSTCHTFNSFADGYGRAEGVGAVYLKRLSDAIRDRDPIRGVIRSSATNNNGKAPAVGITHPSYEGQKSVIQHAYHRGGQLDPRLTGLFECHGTGTAIGDPLEVRAVAHSMNLHRTSEDGPLHLGAVKTNIGHSEAASGLSAIIKAILTVERGIIPPVHGFTDPNPKIDWKDWQVTVPVKPTPFPKDIPVRRTSVNSFGYGGTNAHIIVESAGMLLTKPQTYKYYSPGIKVRKSTRSKFDRQRPYLLVFSAHNKSTLKQNIAAHGAIASRYDLLDLSYTLANRRSVFSNRGMVVSSHAGLENAFSSESQDFSFGTGQTSSLGFAFTGQGSQWPRMATELMAYYPSFLRSIRHLDMVLGDLPDAPEWTLEDALLENASTSRVNEAEFSQPLCTAIQVALVELLHLWNVQPAVACGHSSGEIAAAFAAGYITAADAIVLAYYRGQVVRDINTNGAMMAVGLGAEAVAEYLADRSGRVVVACHNSPESATLSGDANDIQAIEAELTSKNIFTRIVKTNGKAYHSLHMQPAADRYEAAIREAKAYYSRGECLPRRAVMVSSVTNEVVPDDFVMDESYWSANLLNPVLFNQVIQLIGTSSAFSHVGVMIEIGPHSALSGPIRQIKRKYGLDKLDYIPSLARGQDGAASILKVAGELFLKGYPLDMGKATALEDTSGSGKIFRKEGNLIVDLPPYQWDTTKEFWAESRESREHRNPQFPRHDILGQTVIGGSLAEPTWRNVLRIKDLPWLLDHSLGGEAVFPAAGYLSMAMEAMTQLHEIQGLPGKIPGFVFQDVSIRQPLITPDDDNGIEVLLNMRPSIHIAKPGTPWWEFNVSSISEDGNVKNHMVGNIRINTRKQPPAKHIPNLPQQASGKAWYQALKEVGFNYGPTFQDLDKIRFDGKTYSAQAMTQIKTAVSGMLGESRHVLHPASLDSCLQLMIVAIWAGRTGAMKFGAVPVQAEEIAIWRPSDSQVTAGAAIAYSWIDPRGLRSFNAHNQLVGEDGSVLMEIRSMRCSAYEAAIPLRAADLIKPQPYSRMALKPDVDSLMGSQDLDAAGFVALAAFKRPGTKVFVIGESQARAILKCTPDLNLTVGATMAGEESKLLGAKFAHNVKVLPFDFDADLDAQEVLPGSFDIVVAEPTSLKELARCRVLLADGGRAILLKPLDTLQEGLDVIGLSDTGVLLQDPAKVLAQIPETAAATQNGTTTPKVRVLSRTKAALAAQLSTRLHESNVDAVVTTFNEPVPSEPNVVVLDDAKEPWLSTISENEFAGLQAMLSGVSNLIWLSPSTRSHPESAISAGLLRSVRSEQRSLNATHVTFDKSMTNETEIVRKSSLLIQNQIRKASDLETEYYIAGEHILITRLVADVDSNLRFAADQADLRSVQFNPDQALKGVIASGEVIFESAERTDLAPQEVEIRVCATGLNDEDVAIISGTEFETDFSHEVSGIVTKIGSSVSTLSPGDRVVGFSSSQLATFQNVNQNMLRKLGSGEAFPQLAGHPMAYGAAIYGLQTLSSLLPGESVLVLPGAGLSGHAAIHVTKALGGMPHAAVSHISEVQSVMKVFDLDSNQVIVWSEELRPQDLATFDVVFSSGSVDPAIAREAWRNMPRFGRFVNCGRKSPWSRTVLDMTPIMHGASHFSYNLSDLVASRPIAAGKLLDQVLDMYRQRLVPGLPTSVNDIARLNDCVSSFSTDPGAAKMVIEHVPSDASIKIVPNRPQLKLRGDATYFLVGCLGGLGRAIAAWMLKKGARNFAFLSRSGADSKQASIVVNDLKSAGASVQVFRGDAGVKADVERAAASISPKYPVRGVINAAMVLRDGLFYNMTFDSWKASTQPKIRGSWNLHEVFEDEPLDFFTMTSSVSGILGTPGQSNYAAGNTYMDSLARYRRSTGRKAASVILPMVLGVGVVAENVDIEASLKKKGMYGVDQEAVLEALEVAAIQQQDSEQADFDHIVVGLCPAMLQRTERETEGDVDAFWAADPRFSILVAAKQGGSASDDSDQSDSILAKAKRAKDPAEAVHIVREHFIAKLSRILMVDTAEFGDGSGSIASFGIDSMVGAELRNWIFKELVLDIGFQQLLGPSLTITKFAMIVCENQGISV